MRDHIGAALVALAMGVCTSVESHAQSQPKDSTPTFSIFGGRVLNGNGSAGGTTLTNLEFGGSGDFRVSALPVPLRATLAFRQEDHPWTVGAMKYGTLSLDAVGKPLPRIFGAQPYLLGGLGVATRAEFVSTYYNISPDGQLSSPNFRTIPRHTWAFAEGGIGLELGRHLFVQTKLMIPVASQGQVFMPLSIGFRFWD